MNQEHNGKSRSQKKRESIAVQDLGERLATLSPSLLAELELSDSLREALLDRRTIKTREAGRRQMQFIGRLMREEGNEEAIRERLHALTAPGREESAALHRLETLREQLLSATEQELAFLLQKLVRSCPELELPKLRHLVSRAKQERAGGKPPKAYRELFRCLKKCFPANEHAAHDIGSA